MADQANKYDQNIHFADAGNNDNVAATEDDLRNGMTASSSTRLQLRDDANHPRQNYKPVMYQEIPVPENVDPMTRALFLAINQMNYMILSQGKCLMMLEQTCCSRRKHRRPNSRTPLP